MNRFTKIFCFVLAFSLVNNVGWGMGSGVGDEALRNLIAYTEKDDRVQVERTLNQYETYRRFLKDYNHFVRRNRGSIPSSAEKSLLLHAAASGAQNVAKLFLEKGEDVNVRGVIDHKTSLYHAVEYWDQDFIKLLIKGGADPTIENSNRETVFHLALEQHRFKTLVEMILPFVRFDVNKSYGFQNKTLLHLLVDKNESDLLIWFVRFCQSYNIRVQLDPKDLGEATPLQVAVQKGYIECVRELIELGADGTVRTKQKKTLLQIAVGNALYYLKRHRKNLGFFAMIFRRRARKKSLEAVKKHEKLVAYLAQRSDRTEILEMLRVLKGVSVRGVKKIRKILERIVKEKK